MFTLQPLIAGLVEDILRAIREATRSELEALAAPTGAAAARTPPSRLGGATSPRSGRRRMVVPEGSRPRARTSKAEATRDAPEPGGVDDITDPEQLLVRLPRHFAVHGYHRHPVRVDGPWFGVGRRGRDLRTRGAARDQAPRALPEKKGRDLFDLARALDAHPALDRAKVVACFAAYMRHGGTLCSRAEFERNLADREADRTFLGDMQALLAITTGALLRDAYDAHQELGVVRTEFIESLPGEPWRGPSNGTRMRPISPGLQSIGSRPRVLSWEESWWTSEQRSGCETCGPSSARAPSDASGDRCSRRTCFSRSSASWSSEDRSC